MASSLIDSSTAPVFLSSTCNADKIVFEDISMGIMAGKNAGMRVCCIDDDYSADDVDKKKALSDYYIYSYDEVN